MIFFPLSFGVPLGLLVMLGGAILYFSIKHKKIAGGMVISGLVIMGVTIALIVMAVSSPM